MALPDHLADLERKVSARFSEALAEIRLEMRRAVQAETQRASSAMLAGLEAVAPPHAPGLLAAEDLLEVVREAGGEGRRALAQTLRGALVEFDRARTQTAVLQALLEGARQFGDHSALWLMRPEEIVGWASLGYAGDPVAGRTLSHGTSAALARLASGRGGVLLGAAEAAELAGALEVAAPARALLLPLVLRDRVAAALYLDDAATGTFEVEALQVLALAAAQRLELQALATRSFTPTLYLDAEAPASERGLALWDPATPVAGGAESATSGASAAGLAGSAAPAAAAFAEEEAESAWSMSPEEVADDAPQVEPAPSPSLPEFEQATASGDWRDTFEAPAAEEEPPPIVEALSETASEEISWQLEETGGADDKTERVELEAAGLPDLPELPQLSATPESPEALEPADSTWLAATPTHEIPLSPPAPDLAAAERFADAAAAAASEWREVEETTAPHSIFSPAATQRFPAATNEFPQPEPAASALASAASTIAFIPPMPPLAPPAVKEAELSEDATVLMERPAPEPAPPAPSPAIVSTPSSAPADDEPTVSRSRTTEVAPPSDLQGPGWAFSSVRAARSTGDNALHEEARRLARLLVSEIKLYNEDQVEEGRHNRDIYHRLKDDIDRSRQIYEERVHESVRGTTDYFQQELIRSLAGGDPRALGI